MSYCRICANAPAEICPECRDANIKYYTDQKLELEKEIMNARAQISKLSKFELSDKDFDRIIFSLDETGGYLIKETELRFWIEFFVKRELSKIKIRSIYDAKKQAKNLKAKKG